MRKLGIAILSIIILTVACKDKSIILTSPPLSDYYPMQVGKTITYRLDSTVTTSFGAGLTVNSYLVKDSIAAQITDALGRNAFRTFRTFTDTNAVAPYQSMATFESVPVSTNWVEYLDNNMRFMKLRFPIMDGFTWKGNSFIDVTSATIDLSYLADWNYTYQNTAKPDTVLGVIYPQTVTVLQQDQTLPTGAIFDPANYYERTYSIEVYAKGIGLIYKNFLHTVYQPPTPNRPVGYYEDESYGIKLQIISHN